MTRTSDQKVKGAATGNAVEALAPPSVVKDAPALFASAVPEIAAGAWRLLSCDVKGVRKQRRKRIILYHLSYADIGNRDERTVEVVGKLYGSDRASWAYRVLQHLWMRGFRPPGEYLVPRPYGYLSEPPVLLQGSAAGVPLASLLQGDLADLGLAAEGAAGWLARLQACPPSPDLARPPPYRDPVQQTNELAAENVSFIFRLIEVGTETSRRLRNGVGEFAACHGDYHAKNIFMSDGATTVIDFDSFGAHEPGFDVGYFIGQLLIMSYLRQGSFAAGARGALAFWSSYQRLAGRASWHRAATHVARTFVQSLYFELCTLRNGKLDLLPVWLGQCERWLNSQGESTLEDLVRGG